MSDYLVIVESPAKAKTIERYLGKKYNYRLDGGHPKAIRNKIIFYVEDDDIETCVCLRSRINTHFVKIEHRDVLGALLGLNIEKEMIGDIFVLDEEIIIYADASIADFTSSAGI